MVSLFRLMAAACLYLTITVFCAALPLYAEGTHIPKGYDSFDAYEEAMFERIDELARQRGIDVAFLHEDRAALHAEYEAAKQNDDAASMAEARAMQAYIIRYALENLSD
ncbi:hypothetical protein [Thalassococcus sp. S3]|uniref:hypothetical protein n=1 Tax=Thalassococcus sp. S3 TaxID=2017482 RepID=UPI00102411ED|nr:hypothetical protein [Thalassococcus sp. S3]QBF30072.1 hypothetical protein CFI11_02395 [Thalassococcus sp. S3]